MPCDPSRLAGRGRPIVLGALAVALAFSAVGFALVESPTHAVAETGQHGGTTADGVPPEQEPPGPTPPVFTLPPETPPAYSPPAYTPPPETPPAYTPPPETPPAYTPPPETPPAYTPPPETPPAYTPPPETPPAHTPPPETPPPGPPAVLPPSAVPSSSAGAGAVPPSGAQLPTGSSTQTSSPLPIVRPDPSGIAPDVGPVGGGTVVTVIGRHLLGTTAVTFGGVPGRGLRVISDSQLRVTTPPRAKTGRATVHVANAAGTSLGSAVRFRYGTPPVLVKVTPAVGFTGGGGVVTLLGSSMRETTEVRFGETRAKVLTVSASGVRVIAPAARAADLVHIRLTSGGLTSADGPASRFRYVPACTITTLSPTHGPAGGRTRVMLIGTNLRRATQVLFDGAPGKDLKVVSATELRVTSPVRPEAGRVDVEVVTPAGTSADRSRRVTFLYQASGLLPQRDHQWWPFGLIGLLSWSVWGVRRYLSHHRYELAQTDFATTTSVIVPVYREDADVLERCLRTWLRESPTEVILVVDDQDEFLLDRLEALHLPAVRVMPWRHTGKRGALAAGVRAARGEIVVFADSDTQWRPGLLAAIQMPFADPLVGGVGSRQHVYLPSTSIWRRAAYWMLNSRYLDYVPAMSRRGGVACLSGRTAAYRRAVIWPLLPALEHEIFLGRECVSGDDGRLTWLVLAAGFKTVHQATAEAESMFPDTPGAFFRQRLRWSRNSYRCYLTAVSHGWLWRRPIVTQVTVMQVLLTPLTMGAAVWFGSQWLLHGTQAAAWLVLSWAVVGRALRGVSHLRERPSDLLLAPFMALVVAGIALPVKTLAILTMNKQGWLTRQETERVQGQHEIEVGSRAS
jgi:hypothetical protein